MAMRGWLYARLSNDDDPAQNSLQNQQEICRAFAEKSGWTIVGSSADNNISGMNFSRRGLDMLTAAVQAKQIDDLYSLAFWMKNVAGLACKPT